MSPALEGGFLTTGPPGKSLTISLKKKKKPLCETAKKTQMYRTVFWTLWERERVG